MSMREQIVSAAEKVIREQGLARCTTKEISVAAKCSEGTIYRHFKSKEDLFLAVLAERLPGLVPALRALPTTMSGQREVRDTLLRVAREATAFFRESMPMLLSVFAEPKLLDRHRAWMRSHNAGPHRGVELLAEYLDAARGAGHIDADVDAFRAAQLLLGACYLAAYTDMFALDGTSGGEDDERAAESLVRGLWRGLAPAADR